MNWKEDALQLGFPEEEIPHIESIVKRSQQQLLERLSEKLENGFDEYMIKKSGVKALIQKEKERL